MYSTFSTAAGNSNNDDNDNNSCKPKTGFSFSLL